MEEGSPAREKAQRTGRERLKKVESEEAMRDVVQIYVRLSLTLNPFFLCNIFILPILWWNVLPKRERKWVRE